MHEIISCLMKLDHYSWEQINLITTKVNHKAFKINTALIHHYDDLWQIKVLDHLIFVQSIKLLSMRHGLLDFRPTRLINVFMYEISL